MAQPNDTYDPQADKERSPIGDNGIGSNQTSPGRSSYNMGGSAPGAGTYGQPEPDGNPLDREALNDAEEGGGSSDNIGSNQTSPGTSSYGLGGGSSPGTSRGSASSASLRSSEESGAGGVRNTSSTGGYGRDKENLYNAEGDERGGLRGRLGRARNKARDLRSRALRNKLLVGGAMGGGTAVILLILLFSLLIGGYKIVSFAEHVAAYQFARNTAQMAEDATAINEEKLGLEAVPDSASGNQLINALKAKYGAASSKASDLWSKLDKYRPNKVIENFGNQDKLKFNEATTKFGRTYVTSVTVNDEKAGISNETAQLEVKSFSNSLRNTLIPGYKFVTRDVKFSRNFAPDLIDALKANDIGPITRARVASQIRQELGIGLVAWIAGRYLGKTATDSEVAVEQDAYNVAREGSASTITSAGSSGAATSTTSTGSSGGSSSNTIDNIASQADSAEAAQVSDAAQVKNDILPDTNALPSSVRTVLAGLKDSALGLGGTLAGIVGFINPFYKIAVPLCLVYDGSLSSPDAGQTIDTQNTQIERSGLWVQSAASQLKDGTTANAQAVGAFNYKLGDTSNTFAERQASGLPIDTSSFAATEASPTGQYSIADVGLPSPLNKVVDSLGSACPALTNLWVGAVLGGVNIAVSAVVGLLTGGEGDVAIAGGEAAAETAADQAVPSLATRILTKIASGGSKLKDFGIQTGKSIALIGAATLIAKSIVTSKIGAAHNSLATGQPYDDGAYCGTNLYMNQIEQQEYYGAPLTDSRLAADDAANRAQLVYKESQQSTFERYAALNNPDSLMSHLAISVSGYTGRSAFTSLPRLSGALLNPIRSIGSVFTPLLSHSAFAATPVTSVNTYCGNVQFGFTPYEKGLIANDPSYKPLENQQIIDQSGQEQAIANRYTKCFDGSESIGTMLTNGDIQRDSNGDVLPDNGLCSPRNLGTNNVDPAGPPDPASSNGHGWGDLVFRWRVAQGYSNTLDQLSQMQDVNDTGSLGATTTAAGNLPTGSAQDLAKQLLPFISSGKLFCGPAAGGSGPSDCPDIQNTAKGKPLGGNCAVNALTPHLLGLILGLVQDDGWKLGISAMCSDHHPEGDGPYAGHSYGSVADFGVQNADSGAAAAADEKFVNDAAALLSATGGSFGQINCHPPYASIPSSKFTTFADTCTHQHIRAAP